MTSPSAEQAVRDQLVRDHLGYVRAQAVKIRRQVSHRLDLEELVAYGTRGLVEAAGRFDPTKGARFITFAHYRIRGAIFDGLRETGWMRRSQYARFSAGANELLENQSARPGDAPPGGTTAHVGNLAQSLDNLATVFITSLDARPGEPADEETPDGAEVLEAKESSAEVRAAVAQLPEKERTMVELFYFEGMTIQDAGRTMGLSKSWSSRLHARAIQLLGQTLRRQAPG